MGEVINLPMGTMEIRPAEEPGLVHVRFTRPLPLDLALKIANLLNEAMQDDEGCGPEG